MRISCRVVFYTTGLHAESNSQCCFALLTCEQTEEWSALLLMLFGTIFHFLPLEWFIKDVHRDVLLARSCWPILVARMTPPTIRKRVQPFCVIINGQNKKQSQQLPARIKKSSRWFSSNPVDKIVPPALQRDDDNDRGSSSQSSQKLSCVIFSSTDCEVLARRWLLVRLQMKLRFLQGINSRRKLFTVTVVWFSSVHDRFAPVSC